MQAKLDIPTRHFLSLLDWSAGEIHGTLELAKRLKKSLRSQTSPELLRGRTAVLIFEKPSLRTRVTFEVAMVHLGGAAINLSPNSISLGKRESVRDAALNFSRWVDVIVARTYRHQLALDLAAHSSVPVINALTDRFHPCQALALGLTLLEARGRLEGARVVFVGDGNNVANSLATLASKTGMHFVHSGPRGFEQPPELVDAWRGAARASGGSYGYEPNPHAAVSGADLVYTDVWVSMGEEAAADKKSHFLPYQVNADLMAAAPSGCLVSHCLPAHRGEEITDEVMDARYCICMDEAENRLHVQKAVLLFLLVPQTLSAS